MGLIRLLLALTVLITHTHPIYGFTLGTPVIAVRAFFIISGFYMALVLNGKYLSYWSFVSNRFLKIYPIYWMTLLISVILGVAMVLLKGSSYGIVDYYQLYLKDMSWMSIFSLIFSQLLIFGRNTIMFSGFDLSTGLFYWNINISYPISSFPFLLVAQAWTLGLELSFYLLAPFLVKLRSNRIILFGLLLISIRIFTRSLGMVGYYYDTMMFPFELIFFLLGILSHRVYLIIKNNNYNPRLGLYFLCLTVGYLISYQYINLVYINKEISFYVICVVSFPYVFNYFKDSSIDRKVGDYSFPVYISHGIVLKLMYGMFFDKYINNSNLSAIFGFGCTMIFSFFIIRYLQIPIDRWRARRVA